MNLLPGKILSGFGLPRALLATALFVAFAGTPSAHAAYGIENFDVAFANAQGEAVSQAGAHPFAMTDSFTVHGEATLEGGYLLDEPIKDLFATQIVGFAAAPDAVPTCSLADFLTPVEAGRPDCPDSTALGTLAVTASSQTAQAPFYGAVYNLEPAPGEPAKLGIYVTVVPVTIDSHLSEFPPYPIVAGPANASQLSEVVGAELTLWGVPADPRHDPLRGRCLGPQGESTGECPASIAEKPFLTLPRACSGALPTRFESDSWFHPGSYLPDGRPDLADPAWVTGEVLTHDGAGNPQGMTGCGKLAFNPEIAAAPTSRATTSPTGLDFSLDVADEGLTDPDGVAGADIRRVEVTLPEGMSVNPSQAEGLEVCSQVQVARERSFSAAGEGCPEAAKIGSLEVETPLLEGKLLRGSLYVAEPYENPFGSLLALYIVIKDRQLGISVIQPAEVIADPATGRLTTVTDDMPQLPFSHFRLHFREGARSPLVTSPACGSFDVSAKLFPSSGGAAVESTSNFNLISGPGGSACPTAGLPPLHPNLLAGTVNNAAGRFSPFNVRISRADSEQEITHFSIKLPPGVAGRLAGIPSCSEAGIARAAARTGPHGGAEELADPSCPAASQVGRSLAGSGVGPALAYAPGKIYLAGPYHGHPVSLVAITAGVVGPFDIGTVVVRLAIDVNPETGEVFLDSSGSDPIPHIIKGIPIHLRDIRAYTDRPEFTFNPTSCEPTSTAATVLGAGLDFASAADDNPFVSTSRFQAADCAALPFKPKLTFKLKGSTKRAGNPSLRAHVAMNGFGEAAIRYAQVTLPKPEFLDQGHIGTVCTRVQFKEGAVPGEKCPAASVYGKVIARTPILDAPLTGPIFLRSSEHKLPDLVTALHGSQIDIALVGRIDSGNNGGIRNTFEFVPDAPVSSADFTFFGGRKGLLDNSRNLCAGVNKVKVLLKAHSGKRVVYKTPLKPTGCKKKGKKSKRGARHR